jgi:hypothetical protein
MLCLLRWRKKRRAVSEEKQKQNSFVKLCVKLYLCNNKKGMKKFSTSACTLFLILRAVDENCKNVKIVSPVALRYRNKVPAPFRHPETKKM